MVNKDKLGEYLKINPQWNMQNILFLIDQYISKNNYVIFNNRIIITSDQYLEGKEYYYNQLNIFIKDNKIIRINYIKKKKQKIKLDNHIRDIPSIDKN